jgi:hypothetical protein
MCTNAWLLCIVYCIHSLACGTYKTFHLRFPEECKNTCSKSSPSQSRYNSAPMKCIPATVRYCELLLEHLPTSIAPLISVERLARCSLVPYVDLGPRTSRGCHQVCVPLFYLLSSILYLRQSNLWVSSASGKGPWRRATKVWRYSPDTRLCRYAWSVLVILKWSLYWFVCTCSRAAIVAPNIARYKSLDNR